jgi:hypothetical protein
MTNELTDPRAFPDIKDQAQLTAALAKDLTAAGFSVRFKNLHKEGESIAGSVNVNWEERIRGKRIVLINQDFNFSVKAREVIYQHDISLILGIKVHVHADVFVELPNAVCVEARAEWPGGSVGTPKNCQNF